MWGFQEPFPEQLSSDLNDPTLLLWICLTIVADVIANDKSYWLLNPVLGTVLSTGVLNNVYYSIIYEAEIIISSPFYKWKTSCLANLSNVFKGISLDSQGLE